MENQVNRRDFLKLSAAAGVGFVLGEQTTKGSNSCKKETLPRRTLGKTGIQLPVLSMGVSSNHLPVVRAAYNSGVIHFDTANGYQNGKTEEMLGDFFAGKDRDSFVLATKIYEKTPGDLSQRFAEKFETSLKRLRTDYIDILYYHDVSTTDEVNCQPVLDVMLKLKKEGRVKHIGISTHSNEPEVIHTMVDNGNYDVVLTAYNFNQQHHDPLNAAIKRAVESGMGVIGMKAMMGGYMDKERTQKVNAKAALKWVLQNPGIHTVLAGYTSFEELEECLEAVSDLKLTEKESEFLTSVNKHTLLYCQGCRKCVPQCPQKLPVPDMMRAYMYYYGYNDPAMTRDIISAFPLSQNPCSSCVQCNIRCSAGFFVKEKINDMMRIRKTPDKFMI
ncbi:MAG: aldo/keto reductase [Bacteroidales bacterium]|nr:aldo/keto reductase [Bacteroidales bacterium]